MVLIFSSQLLARKRIRSFPKMSIPFKLKLNRNCTARTSSVDLQLHQYPLNFHTSSETHVNTIFFNTFLLFCPPGVLPAWVLPSGSSRAGWGGVSGSRNRGWSWRRAAPLQAGVHCPGAGGSRPTGLLTNQQIPLPPHQREHATPSPLQHGETAGREAGRRRMMRRKSLI